MTSTEFGQIAEQYQRLVYTVCYQLVQDAATAEDLSQDTFLSAWLHRDECPAHQYKPWLARIASNKAKDHLKSAYHRRVAAQDDETLALFPAEAQKYQPEDITVSNDEVNAVRQTILNLKEPYAKVSRMYFLEQKSVDEIAAALGRPLKTVHTQLYRARIMLKAEIAERGS